MSQANPRLLTLKLLVYISIAIIVLSHKALSNPASSSDYYNELRQRLESNAEKRWQRFSIPCVAKICNTCGPTFLGRRKRQAPRLVSFDLDKEYEDYETKRAMERRYGMQMPFCEQCRVQCGY